jgi:cell wall-associated NlpC family hydrolase
VAKKQPNNTTIVTHPKSTAASTKTQDSELATKLKISSKDIRQNKLYSFASDWYGVPYKYAGCTRQGIDCSCFTSILYLQVYKIQLPRSATEMFTSCDKLSIEDAHEGDLVFFKIGGTTISHVGVLVKNSLFIHSSTSKGVVINSLDEAYYKKYFFCAGRVRHA